MDTATPAPGSRREIEIGRVIRESFEIYKHNAAPLIGVALVVFLVIGIVEGLLADAGGAIAQLLATAINLAGIALYTGFVVKLVEDVRDGRRDFTVGQLFSSASQHVGTLIINGVLLGLAVILGLVLLIVPGLILLTIWAVCSPAIVAEDRGPIEAFGRSRELVDGQGMSVFGTILVAFLIQIAVGIIAAAIGIGLGTGALIALSIIASTLTAPVSALVASTLFFDLGGGEGSGPAEGQVVVEY